MTITEGTETTIRVAIVEDRREIREGLSTIINGTPGFRCTGSYRSMEDAFEHIAGDVPDVVLNDIGLPGMSGIDGIRILKERHPGLLVLMLTIYDDDERIFDALCAGASARAPPRGATRGGGGRRADVAGGRSTGHRAVSRVSSTGQHEMRAHAA